MYLYLCIIHYIIYIYMCQVTCWHCENVKEYSNCATVFVAVPQWSPLLSLKLMTVTFILSTISIEDWHFFLLSKCHVCRSHSLTKKYETYCKWRIVSIQMSIFMLKCSIHIKRNSSAQKWLTETGFCYCNSSTAKHYQSTCQK